jgi:hypothetical protein
MMDDRGAKVLRIAKSDTWPVRLIWATAHLKRSQRLWEVQ